MLKGINMPEEIKKEKDKKVEWVKDLIKSKLGVDCKVSEVRKSGPVIIVKNR